MPAVSSPGTKPQPSAQAEAPTAATASPDVIDLNLEPDPVVLTVVSRQNLRRLAWNFLCEIVHMC